MAVNLSPIGNDAPFLDASGNPLSGGKLYTYTAGSSTAQSTYTTSAGSVANANPIVLDSNGYPASGGNVVEIWLTAGVSYKFVLETSASVVVWTRDNISGINDTSVTSDQWVSGPAPTYISGTSFSLVGDQTTDFHVGRRVKTTNSGGTIYSTILTSAYTTLTTITVVNDSGTLDSGLSAVSYGVVSADNTSDPLLADTYPVRSGSSDKTKKVRLEVDGLTTGTTRVLTIQDKDVTLGSFADSSDATKKITFGLSGITTATTRTITVADNDFAIGKKPTRQSFITGTSATYTTPSGATRLYIRMIGGGGGGGGSAGGNGGAGGDTSFNSVVAKGGSGGTGGSGTANTVGPGGAGGTGGTGTATNRIDGGDGGDGAVINASVSVVLAGNGGSGGFGGGGKGTTGGNGNAGKAYGSGGGGGQTATGPVGGGGGGGAGEYAELVINTPSATYTYSVGAAGSAGAGSIQNGGAGKVGIIIVDEYYD